MQWPFVKRSTYEEVCEAARDHGLRAARAENDAYCLREELAQRKQVWRQEQAIQLARYDALLEHLSKMVSLTPPAPIVIHGDIPDPPSVTQADAKVAVALRDREASPLKRPLRPGEDE